MWLILQTVLGLIVIVLSGFWMTNEAGYEPKIVFIIALASLVALFTKIYDEVESKKNASKLIKSESRESIVPTADATCEMIKRHDYHFSKATTVYPACLAILLCFLTLWGMTVTNERLISKYDKYIAGEITLEPNEVFTYESVVSREAFITERNQMTGIALITVLLLSAYGIRSFILDRILKNLDAKTKYISQRDDFVVFSEEVNKNLQGYNFANRDVLELVVRNFTKITKECYIHNVM